MSDIYVNLEELEANISTISVEKYGFFLCKSGAAKVLLGEKVYNIGPDDLCIYTPGSSLHIINRSDDLSGILRKGAIEEYFDVVSGIDVRDRLKMRMSPCVSVSHSDTEKIEKFSMLVDECENLIQLTSDNETTSIQQIRTHKLHAVKTALCMQIFESYFKNVLLETLPLGKEDVIFNKFLMAAYKSRGKIRSVKHFASLQHLSPYYFSSIICEKSGRTVMQWLEQITMVYAKQMLECSTDSVKEIAEKLNFPDQSTFGRYFKHRMKISPTEFRKRLKINL